VNIFYLMACLLSLSSGSAWQQTVIAKGTPDSARAAESSTKSPALAKASPDTSAIPAEYAIRWNVKEGGPKTAKEVLDVLEQQLKDSDGYEVQYFDFTPPQDAPAGVKSILRQRKKDKKKYELTFKYRSDHPLQHFRCPIADKPDESKEEVDISILGPKESSRAYSYSCTIESKNDPVQPPSSLAARPMGCTSKMTRIKTSKVEIEE